MTFQRDAADIDRGRGGVRMPTLLQGLVLQGAGDWFSDTPGAGEGIPPYAAYPRGQVTGGNA